MRIYIIQLKDVNLASSVFAEIVGKYGPRVLQVEKATMTAACSEYSSKTHFLFFFK